MPTPDKIIGPAGEELPNIGPGSEDLKHLAEDAVHIFGLTGAVGRALMTGIGLRVVDKRLETEVAGIHFENPLIVGAGWDKTGKCVDGLHALGFAGTEVGTVLVQPQEGNPKPRMWTDREHRAGLNRLGFNSLGMEAVAANLARQKRPGVVGISLGKNKVTPMESAPEEHAAVAKRLYEFADYFVINVASPNTPGLRTLLNAKPLTEIVVAVQEVLKAKGPKPLFVKTTIDLALEDLDSVLKVCIDNGVDGIVDTNTTIDNKLKAEYGWGGQPGGLSGDNPEYRRRANERMKHITRHTKGTGLRRIGVGGVHDAATAIERLEAGAEVLQVVTAIRQHLGFVAGPINRGILAELKRRGLSHVSELVGQAAK